MEEPIAGFYDVLAEDYHSMYLDWNAEVLRQGEVLDALIRRELGRKPASILDCTCGIGTQAIGMAARGYRVTATDFSAGAVDRARREAATFGVGIEFGVADIRSLGSVVTNTFDAVLSCDNSLSHLLEDEDLLQAAVQIRGRLNPGGLLIATIRDYDQVIRERKASVDAFTPLPGVTVPEAMMRLQPTLPRVFPDPQGQRIVFQVWDWTEDLRSYAVHHFHLHQQGDSWDTRCYVSRFRALLRDQLSLALEKAGFREIRWLMPDESGYYQPVVVARNAGEFNSRV